MQIILVHGSWHDGNLLSDVASSLRQANHDVHTPTIDGHGQGADTTVSHEDCVRSIVEYIRGHDLSGFALLGHSFGGTVIQRVAEELPDRVRRLIFHNAFVLNDGESLVDCVPPHHQEIWPSLVGEKGALMLPFAVWRDAFMGEADLEFARACYDKLSPTPARSHFDKVALKTFAGLRNIGKSYLFATEDAVLPSGEQFGWFPRFANRLGGCRIVTMPGGHEVCFTNPALLAEKIIIAGRD